MDGAPSEGCSTTTILAQLSIERDAGAGAVHTIIDTAHFAIAGLSRQTPSDRMKKPAALVRLHKLQNASINFRVGVGLRITSTVKSKPPTRPSFEPVADDGFENMPVGVALPMRPAALPERLPRCV
jgi:hypothetical protein